MLIFQRLVTLQGPPQETARWALEITELANRRTQLNAALWQGLFGGPLGTFAWTAQLENLTALEAASDALLGDADYLAKVEEAQEWVSGDIVDNVVRVAHVAGGDYVRPAVGAYAEATMGVPAAGRLREAAAWGVDIAERHSAIGHSTVLFGSAGYGDFGTLVWFTLYDSADAVDRAAEAIAKDEEYAKAIDAGGPLFEPGSALRQLSRRIA